MQPEQYVCTVCGYNMVGYHPHKCPFCGACDDTFITSQHCSDTYQVQETPVSEQVTRLNSVPALGFEHAAYRIETPEKVYWIDCPSCFDKRLDAADVLKFNHHHFLGASNLYRQHFAADVRIHHNDSEHLFCRGFTFDSPFSSDFSENGIEAFHIDGHTPGFTIYFFADILFICDYVFLHDGVMKFNPCGPHDKTVAGGHTIVKLLQGRTIRTVCGYNTVTDYHVWEPLFNELLEQGDS